MFDGGRTNVHNIETSGHPLVAADGLKARTEEIIISYLSVNSDGSVQSSHLREDCAYFHTTTPTVAARRLCQIREAGWESQRHSVSG